MRHTKLITYVTAAIAALGFATTMATTTQTTHAASFQSTLKASGMRYVKKDKEGNFIYTDGKDNYSFEGGRWSKRNLTVSIYSFPKIATPAGNKIIHEGLLTAIDRVNAGGANITMRYVGDGVKSADIKVYYEDLNHPKELDDAVGMSETTYWDSNDSCKVWLAYDPQGKETIMVWLTLHEFGHTLGLGHTYDITKTQNVLGTWGGFNSPREPNPQYYYRGLLSLYGKRTAKSIIGVGQVNYNRNYGIQIWTKDGKPVRYNKAEAKKMHHKVGDAKKLQGQSKWKIFANTYTAHGTTYYNLGGDQYIDANYITLR